MKNYHYLFQSIFKRKDQKWAEGRMKDDRDGNYLQNMKDKDK